MSENVTVESRDSVLVVTMDDGKANALSTALSTILLEAVDRAEADDSVRAMVLAGRPGRFCAGFDLSVMQAGDMAAADEMVAAGGRLVSRLYGSSIPVVAACTGHAVAAGALLLLGCDHRVGPEAPVKLGLNEVAIGMVLPGWARTIAAARLSNRHVQASVVNSRIYDPAGAVDAGFLDEVVAPDAVVDTAITHAAALAEALNPGAYAGTVRAFRGATLDRMAESL